MAVKPRLSRWIALLFLLVLVSLSAHMLADIQPLGAGVEANLDACPLHGVVLLPVLDMPIAVLVVGHILAQHGHSHYTDNPPLFHPPAL